MDDLFRSALEKQNPWWFDKSFELGVPRLEYYPLIEKFFKVKEVLLLVGARRTGKSTLIYQLINSLKVKPKSILYINLDEPLFQSKASDATFLTNLLESYFTENKDIEKFYVFIDEIQNYEYWTGTIKTFYDVSKNVKFTLTGSTSTLLQGSASTKLSGRYLAVTVHPLSFKEFLNFEKIEKPTLQEKKSASTSYLKYGAFPRVVLEKDVSIKREVLKNYFETIYLKDIVYPYKIRNNKEVFELLYYALSNVGKPFSYSNIAKTLGVSTETVQEYLSYAEQAYLLFSVNKFDYSVKKQMSNQKKFYCLDTGLVNSLSFKFSENKGALLENLVFNNLKTNNSEIYYYKGANECDFVIKEGLKIVRAIQVTVSMADDQTKKREIRGLLDALNEYNLKEGEIITENEKQTLDIEGKTIHVIPIHEWLQ